MVLLDSRSQASQWDYGLYVLFSNDDGVVAGQEVHFASQGDGVASVVLAESTTDGIVCAIPNHLLTDSRTIRIYAYVDDGETGRTVKRWQLPVFARPRPDDYVFEETEVRRYETLSAELSAEVTARQSADTALQTAIAGKQNKLTAGQNITIANNVISAAVGAVSSVNEKTGDVVLTANDIGYDEESARTQPLTTVSGYINAQEEVLNTIFDWLPDGGSVGDVLTKTASGTEWHTGGGGSGAVSSVNGQTGAVVLSASDVGALPDSTVIPSAYDDTEVRGLISAKYSKPSSGIPKTDLASAVRTSLGKADTALQSLPTHTHAQSDITGLSTALAGKADASNVYTKQEIDDRIGVVDSLADLIIEAVGV